MAMTNGEEFAIEIRITARRGRGNHVSTVRIEANVAGLDTRADVEKALQEIAETVRRLPHQNEEAMQ
jgi:hypothetical protein